MPAAAVCTLGPDAVAGEMTAVLANMVESALAGGLLSVSEPREVGGDDARGAEGDRAAPAPDRGRLGSAVHAGAGARAHRVDRPPVRAGGGGGPVGVAGG